jgi:hypothetical protein
MFNLSAKTQAAQQAYVEEVSAQLGIGRSAADTHDIHLRAKAN